MKLLLFGNKAKGRISKRVFQENKARQFFRKAKNFYPLTRTRTYAQVLMKKCLVYYSIIKLNLINMSLHYAAKPHKS